MLHGPLKTTGKMCAWNPMGSTGLPFTTFWSLPATSSLITPRTRRQFMVRKPTSGMPNELPTFSSTILFLVALSHRWMSTSAGIWFVTAGRLPTSLPERKNGHRTALLFPISNWITYSQFASAITS